MARISSSPRPHLVSLFALLACAWTATACSSSGTAAPVADAAPDLGLVADDLLVPDESCAFTCDPACEPQGYACASLGAWNQIPHKDACPAWDGSFPTPVKGQCKASVPAGEAAKKTGTDPDDASSFVLPTGARAKPVGKSSIFADFKGQFPTNVVSVPGSDLVVVIDGGIQEQSVRLVDTTKIGNGDPVVGSTKFVGTTMVNFGAVILAPAGGPSRLYVSGGAGAVVYAFTIDVAGKTLTRTADADLKLARAGTDPKGGGLADQYYLSGLAASRDGKRLFVGTANNPAATTQLLVVDVDPASATYKTITKKIPLAAREIFALALAPASADAEGRYVYASIWDAGRVDVIDTQTGTVRSLAVAGYPEVIAPIGPRYLAVVNAAGDSISVLDTLTPTGGVVLTVPIVEGSAHGWAPSGLVYDEAAKRLYVSLAGMNAIAAYAVDLPASGTPTLAPAGMLPSDWWPTAVALRSDGSLVVITGKGHGTGPAPTPNGDSITNKMRGSIQLVSTPDAAMLSAGKATVEAASNVGALAGAPKVDCGGAAYDFPVPETNTKGPSDKIKHVVFIVKENKTFDSVFGDLPGVDGDPSLVLIPGKQATIFANQRKVAQAFTNFDNYYTSAEQSVQGHIWTAFGRTSEYTERTWLVAWGRAVWNPVATTKSRDVEGSVFDWLGREGVPFDNMGEATGAPDGAGGIDLRYPGLPNASPGEPDNRRACYVAARTRVSCDLKAFTYALQSNDHTQGLSAGAATPETYIAVGDEGLGILLDALSHAPTWPETLLIVTEDDPQDGGDHVDNHRTPLYMAGPWVKRGYVSKGHYDTSSIHKLFAHLFGKPYNSETVARASLPLDAFTSTPDYTPYERVARTVTLGCNPSGTSGAVTAAMSKWDFSQPDQAPGLSKQLWEHFHPGDPRAVTGAGLVDDDD
jgi:hypothetical protein